MRLVGRLIVVPLALLLAALAGGFTLLTLGQEQMVKALHAGASDEAMFGLLGALLKIGLVLLSPQILAVPLLIGIGGEVARIRSASFYVAAFGAFAAAIPLLGRVAPETAGSVPLWALFATAGFAGGIVYWLIAGRSAGN
jgi:hypothetical protein